MFDAFVFMADSRELYGLVQDVTRISRNGFYWRIHQANVKKGSDLLLRADVFTVQLVCCHDACDS